MRLYLGFIAAFVAVVAVLLITQPDRLFSHSKIQEEPSSGIPYHVRANANLNFAASETAVAFPIPLSRDTGGIVFFDRTAQVARIVVEPDVYLASPHFSADGKRILLVSGPNSRKPRQLLSCEVATWKCKILWETNNTIFSPVYADGEAVLFSSSPPVREGPDRERFSRHNFFLLRADGHVDQLSDTGFYQLGSFSFSKSTLMFTAVGASKKDFILEDASTRTRSSIYSIGFDPSSRRIPTPDSPLKPLFVFDGVSSFPAISPDGGMVVFLNQLIAGKGRYDLVIGTVDGNVVKRIESDESFSRAQITKTEIVANELGENAYRVHAFTRDRFERRLILELKFSPDEIGKLETRKLEILPR